MDEKNLKKYIRSAITIILTLAIALFVILGIKYCGGKMNTNPNVSEDTQNGSINYEILDSNIFNEGEMKEWIDECIINEGLYYKNYEDYTYILISGGFKPTTGYGIALEAIAGDKSKISVSYSVISPMNDVVDKDCYPNMVIRIPLDKRKIEAKFIDESELNLVKSIDNVSDIKNVDDN